jgi:hypothetical protein
MSKEKKIRKTRPVTSRIDEYTLARLLDYYANHKGIQFKTLSELVNKSLGLLVKSLEAQTSITYNPIPFPSTQVAKTYINNQLGISTKVNLEDAIIIQDEQEFNPIKMLKEAEKGSDEK